MLSSKMSSFSLVIAVVVVSGRLATRTWRSLLLLEALLLLLRPRNHPVIPPPFFSSVSSFVDMLSEKAVVGGSFQQYAMQSTGRCGCGLAWIGGIWIHERLPTRLKIYAFLLHFFGIVLIMATPQCLSDFYKTVISCGYVYGAIFLWNILTWVLYQNCLSERIRGAPFLDAQFYAVAGIVQISAVSLALVSFRPVCDCSISCPSYIPILYAIPALEGLIGIFCWIEACRRRHMAQQVAKDGVFTKIPTEMELTEIEEEDEFSDAEDALENNHNEEA